ncbi:metallophosphoesterase family protein [Candidatus Micrarchaeota archaeon]|nr:metallophosphoesterase family protein [Candidatus Micrarchaeota archaeon]
MKFLYNAPAILHKGAIIVGDTHFGMEDKLRRKGIYDEEFSLRLFSRLKGLIVSHKAKKLILLGDVKEDITMLDKRTEDILAKLSMLCEITIVRGNHDGGIEHCANAEIAKAEGFAYEGLGLIHGHSWPSDDVMACGHVIAGHQHPLITMTDAFGRKRSEPVWVMAPPDAERIAERYKKFNKKIKLVLMPAFNPLVGSTINHDEKERLGPLLNNNLFKLNHAIVFRLDGTCLGELKNIH